MQRKPSGWIGLTMFAVSLSITLPVTSSCAASQTGKTQAAHSIDEEWGEAQEGLQIALTLENPKRDYRSGDTLTFVLRARNVGNTLFEHSIRKSNLPSLTLVANNRLRYEGIPGETIPFRLEPGQESPLPGGTFQLRLLPLGDTSPVGIGKAHEQAEEPTTSVMLLPGKYTLECSYPIWMAEEEDENRATAHRAKPRPFSFVVRESPLLPRAGIVQRFDPTQQSIVWGEIVNGLQCGITALSGRAANVSDAGMVFNLYVRNTTDQTLDLSYPSLRPYDTHPNITRADGSHVEVCAVFLSGFRGYSQAVLKSGEMVKFATSHLNLQPPGENLEKNGIVPAMIAEPGKYRVSLVGNICYTGLTGFYVFLVSPDITFTLSRQK